jgi:hypothetical protein
LASVARRDAVREDTIIYLDVCRVAKQMVQRAVQLQNSHFEWKLTMAQLVEVLLGNFPSINKYKLPVVTLLYFSHIIIIKNIIGYSMAPRLVRVAVGLLSWRKSFDSRAAHI